MNCISYRPHPKDMEGYVFTYIYNTSIGSMPFLWWGGGSPHLHSIILPLGTCPFLEWGYPNQVNMGYLHLLTPPPPSTSLPRQTMDCICCGRYFYVLPTFNFASLCEIEKCKITLANTSVRQLSSTGEYGFFTTHIISFTIFTPRFSVAFPFTMRFALVESVHILSHFYFCIIQYEYSLALITYIFTHHQHLPSHGGFRWIWAVSQVSISVLMAVQYPGLVNVMSNHPDLIVLTHYTSGTFQQSHSTGINP